MLKLRKAEDRGHSNLGWLDSHHTFSFGEYYDPNYLGFSSLRVINDDRVAPGAGFGTHGHRDMEILSYVMDGALEHKDSMGTGSVIRPGEIQMMRAGTGVTHSEFNASKTDDVHFLQIWIVPDTPGLRPAYAQNRVDRDAAGDAFALLASRDGRNASIQIHQDTDLWLAILDGGAARTFDLRPGRKAWIHTVRGSATVNGIDLHGGDGVAVTGEHVLHFASPSTAEVMVFDLA